MSHTHPSAAAPPLALLAATLALSACASTDHHTKAPDPSEPLNNVQAARARAVVAQDLEATGDVRGAIMNYEMARSLDPRDNQWVALQLAMLYSEVGDRVAADIEFRRAWRLDPFDPAVLAAWHEN